MMTRAAFANGDASFVRGDTEKATARDCTSSVVRCDG